MRLAVRNSIERTEYTERADSSRLELLERV